MNRRSVPLKVIVRAHRVTEHTHTHTYTTDRLRYVTTKVVGKEKDTTARVTQRPRQRSVYDTDEYIHSLGQKTVSDAVELVRLILLVYLQSHDTDKHRLAVYLRRISLTVDEWTDTHSATYLTHNELSVDIPNPQSLHRPSTTQLPAQHLYDHQAFSGTRTSRHHTVEC